MRYSRLTAAAACSSRAFGERATTWPTSNSRAVTKCRQPSLGARWSGCCTGGSRERDKVGAGILLLRDMRELHLAAARARSRRPPSVRARRRSATRSCSTRDGLPPRDDRTTKWTVQRVKEASLQVLAG